MLSRIVLGIYLTIHFVQLLPFAEKLFGKEMPFDPTGSPVYGVLPNLLSESSSGAQYISATLFIRLMIVFSIMLASEICPRIAAFLLWYGWACLFNRNILISNPGLPYVGWVLLALCFVEKEKPAILDRIQNPILRYLKKDRLPRRLFWSAWILMALGYTASGLHKLVVSPSWRDGTALQYVLEGSLARDNWIRNLLIQYPTFLRLNTYLSLFLEISFLPLGTFYYTRLPYWIIYMAFHFGILLTINFADLTLGVMMVHLLTFDHLWIEWFSSISQGRIKSE